MLKKVLSNMYIFSLSSKLILIFFGLLDTVFINRYLGPALKGEYIYMLNIVTIFVLILNLGIYQSYPYFKRKSDNVQLKDKFLNVVIVQFLFYMIIAIIISLLFNRITYTIIFTLIPLMILSRQFMFICLVENLYLRNILTIGNEIIYTLALFIIFMFAPQNYLYIIALLYLKDIVYIISIIIKFKFKINIFDLDLQLLKESLKFGLYPMITAFLMTVNYKFDIILLKFFVDFEQIGYYTVGVGLADKIWVIPDAFKDVLFSKTARKDSVEDIVLSIKINLYISAVIAICIVMLGKPIITLLYGMEFIESYNVTVVIFLGVIPMIFFKLINTLFVAKGKQKLSFVILLCSAILNVICNLLLIPIFGIIGAALASTVSYSLCGGLFLYIFVKEWNLKYKDIFFITEQEKSRIKLFQPRSK